MRLIYEGTDITEYVNIRSCVCRDYSSGRADSLDIGMDRAATWYRWAPQVDDRIRVTADGFDTGELYVDAIAPQDGRFRILATGLSRAARRRAWASYRDMTLAQVAQACAAECGMGSVLYGAEPNLKYGYLLRRGEGCAAFLDRLGSWEGVAFKAYNGAFRGISVAWAQAQTADIELEISAGMSGVRHTRRDAARLSGVIVCSVCGEAAAVDSTAVGLNARRIALPAGDLAQAGRWARGLLLAENRQAEQLSIESTFNPAMTAMARVDVSGDSGAAGAWLVDHAEHDLMNRRTRTTLYRCVTTIQ